MLLMHQCGIIQIVHLKVQQVHNGGLCRLTGGLAAVLPRGMWMVRLFLVAWATATSTVRTVSAPPFLSNLVYNGKVEMVPQQAHMKLPKTVDANIIDYVK